MKQIVLPGAAVRATTKHNLVVADEHRHAPSNSLFDFVLINFTEAGDSLGMPDQPTKHDH